MSSSPFMTAPEAAEYLRFPNVNAFDQWRWRHPHKLPAYKRGRVRLFKKVDVELAVEKEGAALEAFRRKVGA